MIIFDQLDALVSHLKQTTQGHLNTDSRQILSADVFIAWPGAAVDGRQFVDQALAKGASWCIVETNQIEKFEKALWFNNDRIIGVDNLKAHTGVIASAYYSHPTQKMQLIAVTGTNGKTSSAWWIASCLQQLQLNTTQKVKCAVVGTLGIGEPGHIVANGLTTPDPVLLQKSLAALHLDGVTHCAIEASSIGLVENRLAGCDIAVAMFTNLTQDHLDYHGNLENYWQAKKSLFAWPNLQNAIINLDDTYGYALANELQTKHSPELWTIACNQIARIQAQNIVFYADSVSFEVIERDPHHPETVINQASLHCNIIGNYNVSNLLGVIAAIRSLGWPLADIIKACENISPVPGRMEVITQANCPTVAIDYAHTPDALEKALLALRPSVQNNNGKLWCVFGCGGNRDSSKRPLMAKIAEQWADTVVLTSDNPRFEDPNQIIADAQAGFVGKDSSMISTIVNRTNAIDWAIENAKANDVILIAGKGHETYQEIAGVKHDYSDHLVAQAALQKRNSLC